MPKGEMSIHEMAKLLKAATKGAGPDEMMKLVQAAMGGKQEKLEKTVPSSDTVYQLRIDLAHAKPPIWRRVLVGANTPLDVLHDVIQVLFDWDNSHLYGFTYQGEPVGPENESPWGFGSFGFEEEEQDEEEEYQEDVLSDFLCKKGQQMRYTYDFGDSWDHVIKLEKVLKAEKGIYYPRCLTGKNAAPVEDCGGLWGYYDLVKAVTDEDHERHEDAVEYLGKNYDPVAFDQEGTNKRFEGWGALFEG